MQNGRSRTKTHARRHAPPPQRSGGPPARPIIGAELGPGMRLNERLLTAQLGLSRTPLREAFKVLATEGLVEYCPTAAPSSRNWTRAARRIARGDGRAGSARRRTRLPTPDADNEMRAASRCWPIMRAMISPAVLQVQPGDPSQARQIFGQRGALQHLPADNGNVRRARYMANLSKERWDAAVAEHDEILAALGSRDIKRARADGIPHAQQMRRSDQGAALEAIISSASLRACLRELPPARPSTARKFRNSRI